MDTAPLNIFTRITDPAGVARLLRRLHPSVVIDGPDDDWRSAAITFGRLWMKRRLTFIHDPEYHAEPNWSTQMRGMRLHFRRYPESTRKQIAMMLPATFRYALSARLEPGLVPSGDARFGLALAVASTWTASRSPPARSSTPAGRLVTGLQGGDAGARAVPPPMLHHPGPASFERRT